MDPKRNRAVTYHGGELPPQGHTTLQLRGQVIDKKRYICTFTSPMAPKLRKVVTQDAGTMPTKSRGISIMWSIGN